MLTWIKDNKTALIAGAAAGVGALMIVAHIPAVGAVVKFLLGLN